MTMLQGSGSIKRGTVVKKIVTAKWYIKCPIVGYKIGDRSALYQEAAETLPGATGSPPSRAPNHIHTIQDNTSLLSLCRDCKASRMSS